MDYIVEIIRKISSGEREQRKAALLMSQDLVDHRLVEPCLRLLSDEDRDIRNLARTLLETLVEELNISEQELLVYRHRIDLARARMMLRSQDAAERFRGISIFVSAGASEHIMLFLEHLKHEEDEEIITYILRILGGTGKRIVIKVLKKYLNAKSEDVRLAAVDGLAVAHNQGAYRVLASYITRQPEHLQAKMARSLCAQPLFIGELGLPLVPRGLVKGLYSLDEEARIRACDSLGESNHLSAAIPLMAASIDSSRKVQYRARRAMSELQEGDCRPLKKKRTHGGGAGIGRRKQRVESNSLFGEADWVPAMRVLVILMCAALGYGITVLHWYDGLFTPPENRSAASSEEWLGKYMAPVGVPHPETKAMTLAGVLERSASPAGPVTIRSSGYRVVLDGHGQCFDNVRLGDRVVARGTVKGISDFGAIVLDKWSVSLSVKGSETIRKPFGNRPETVERTKHQ